MTRLIYSLQLLADEWNWLLWSRMNTISSRKPSKEVATVLHSVLSRCSAVLPADCLFRMGNHVGQFFRMYELKPLVTNVEGTGSSTQETPLIHKFLVRQPVKKETAADPDYHPDSMSDAESDSNPCSDAVLSPDLVKDEGAKAVAIAPKPSKSLLSKEGKGNVERENAWQAIGFAVGGTSTAMRLPSGRGNKLQSSKTRVRHCYSWRGRRHQRPSRHTKLKNRCLRIASHL